METSTTAYDTPIDGLFTTSSTIEADRENLSQRLINLADQVDDSDEGAGIRLRNLATAVKQPNASYAAGWADSPLFTLINPQHIAEDIENFSAADKRLGWLEAIRNASFLVPILLTWFGIWQAVNHYYQYLQANPDQATQPFLLLWQGGFGDTTSLTLSFVARLDVFLLLIVLGLTLGTYWYANRVQRMRQRNIMRCRIAIEHTLAFASLLLKTQRANQPVAVTMDFKELAQQSVEAIVGARDELMAITELRKQETDKLKQVVDGFSSAHTNLRTVSETMAMSAQSLQEAAGALNGTAVGLTNLLTKSTGQQSQLLSTYEQTVSQLKLVTDNHQQLVTGMTEMRSTLDEGVKSISEAMPGLSDMADKLHDLSQRLVEEQTKLVDALTSQGQTQTQVAGMVSAAASDINQSLKEVNSYAANLHAMATDMRKLVDTIRALPDNYSADVRYILEQQGTSTKRISDASKAMELAAQSISQSLRRTTSNGGQGSS